MRLLFRAMTWGVLGLSLGIPAAATAQPSGAGPAASTSGVRSATSSKDARGAGAAEPSGRGRQAGKRAVVRRKERAIDPKEPLAQAPGFEMRENGTSVVTVLLTRAAEITRVEQKRSPGNSVLFELARVQVGVHNNTNPLVTEHFDTPLKRVVLRRKGKDALLRLDLREKVEVTYSLKPGPGGTSLLEIVVPKGTKKYGRLAPPTSSGDRSEGRGELRLGEEPAPGGPPGPRP